MIRFALPRSQCAIQRLRSSQHSLSRHFSAATTADESPKGTPYSKLIVGIPKENYPLEKRVAATPEVCMIECR